MTPGNRFREYEKNANWKKMLKKSKTNITHPSEITRLRDAILQKQQCNWDTSTSSQVSNCDDDMLENYLDHRVCTVNLLHKM